MCIGNSDPQLTNTAVTRTRSCRRLWGHWTLQNNSGEILSDWTTLTVAEQWLCPPAAETLSCGWVTGVTQSLTRATAVLKMNTSFVWREEIHQIQARSVTSYLRMSCQNHLNVCVCVCLCLGHQWLIPRVAYVTAAWLMNCLNQWWITLWVRWPLQEIKRFAAHIRNNTRILLICR